MAANDYHFVTEWSMKGKIEDVYDLLADPIHYPDWWFPGNLEAKELVRGRPDGIGRIVSLELKNVIAYTLSWRLENIEAVKPYRLKAQSSGDFAGQGIWTLREENGGVKAVFDWKIRAEKPFLKTFSPVLKPFFIWNHHRVMAAGERGLNRKLSESINSD